MDDITVFNLRVVNKGALKATMSIRLGNGLTIHDCKIIQQDGALSAALPQRAERQKAGRGNPFRPRSRLLLPLTLGSCRAASRPLFSHFLVAF